ncbi:HNH endonuclease [Burkholderia pseudomallei]|uniref:HNH endonuclease n=1 Tax=Burkholderia pseudomallei TaxID=28450 RepID=UPI00097622A5|nr:HNH endonuclease [Burkholderia pseudomallei]
MKTIPLTHGRVAFVDDEDFAILSKHKWHLSDDGYACTTVRHPVDVWRHVRTSMHRMLLGLVPGDPRQGDHKDRNRLNNRRANLRIATVGQNNQNHGTPSTNTSGCKGVTWDKERSKWKATVYSEGKNRTVGRFTDREDAVNAYKAAVRAHHGEFACVDD